MLECVYNLIEHLQQHLIFFVIEQFHTLHSQHLTLYSQHMTLYSQHMTLHSQHITL